MALYKQRDGEVHAWPARELNMPQAAQLLISHGCDATELDLLDDLYHLADSAGPLLDGMGETMFVIWLRDDQPDQLMFDFVGHDVFQIMFEEVR